MQLISSKQEVQFRGPTSSEATNKQVNESYYDMTQLFNLAAEHGIKIPQNLDLLMRENHFLGLMIDKLQVLVDNLGASGKLSYAYSDSTDVTPSGKVDTDYRILTQPSAQQVSKTFLLDANGNSIIPDELGITLYESAAAFTNITALPGTASDIPSDVKRTDLIKAFTLKDTDYWQRKISKDASVGEMYAVLHIKLPKNIINNYKVNTIYLKPSPEFAQTLLDIQYKGASGWGRLPTYPTEINGGSTTPVAIPTMTREAFIFPATDVTELLIYIKQPNYFVETGKHLFVYGFHYIGVLLTRFGEADTVVRTKFAIPDPANNSFGSINAVSLIKAKGGIDPANLVTTKIFVEGNTTEYGLGQELPVGTDVVYIETTLKTDKVLNVAPTLSGIEIQYT